MSEQSQDLTFMVTLVCVFVVIWTFIFFKPDHRPVKYYVVEGVKCTQMRAHQQCGYWLEGCSDEIVRKCMQNVRMIREGTK